MVEKELPAISSCTPLHEKLDSSGFCHRASAFSSSLSRVGIGSLRGKGLQGGLCVWMHRTR